jgi:hypothetical protein
LYVKKKIYKIAYLSSGDRVAERMVGKVKNYSTKPYKENSEPRTGDKSFASTMLLETVKRWQK